MCAEGFEETEIVYEVDNKDRGVWSGVGEDGVKNEEEDVDDLDEQGKRLNNFNSSIVPREENYIKTYSESR